MSVISFPTRSELMSLRKAYRAALADGWNALVDVGSIDKESSRMMVGFLSAATIALKLTGDEVAADMFESAAQKLNTNWKTFEDVVPALIAGIDALIS